MLDDTTGLLRITYDQLENLQSLYFNVSGSIFELIPNAQIWPRALNKAIGGEPGFVYLVVADVSFFTILHHSTHTYHSVDRQQLWHRP